jgi:tetratricopeptide (TPR) repeat protein
MSSHRLLLWFLVPALALLTGAKEDDGGVYETSRHGVVSGPLEAPPEPRTDAVDRLKKEFGQARLDLDEGRLESAARRFDGIFDEAGWAEAAYNASLAYYGLGRYDHALERSARVALRLPDDLPGLHLRGVLLRLHGRHGDAEEVSERALELARAAGDRYAEAMGLLNLASSRRSLGRPSDAQASIDAARALGEALTRPEIIAASWLVSGYLARDRGDSAAADRAFAAARRSGLGRSEAGAELDVRLAGAEDAVAAGEMARARRLASDLLPAVRKETSRQMRAVHLLRLAEVENELGSAVAETLLGEAEKLFAQGGVEVGRADVLAARARWRFNAGALQEAEDLLLPCIEIREGLQVPLALAGSRLMLAQVRLEQGRLDEALALSRGAGKVLGAAGQAREHRAALLVQSDVLLHSGDLQGALEAARTVRSDAARLGAAADEVSGRVQETIVLARLGDIDAALETWRIARRPGARLSARRIVRGELALAHALEGAGRAEEGLAMARSALAALDAAPAEDSVRSPALVDAVVEAVVASMLSRGDTEGAAKLLSERGRSGGALALSVRKRADQQRHNAAVEAYESGDLTTARTAFQEIVDDEKVSEGLRASAARNLCAAIEGLARAHFDRGALVEAQAGFEHLLAIARGREDRRVEARAGFRLAEIRTRVEDPTGAAEYAEAAAKAAAMTDDSDLEAGLWAMAGDLLFESEPKRARADLRNALAAWVGNDRVLGKRASVTYNLALLSYQLDDPGEAAIRAKEARVLAERAGRDDLVKMADELTATLKE